LAGAGTAGDEDVEARARGDLQHLGHVLGDVPLLGHDVERDPLLRELTNGDAGTVDGERGDDDVDAAAVEEARVAKGVRFVDAAADLRDDTTADVEDVLVVAELDVR